ncbi:hypothetical protein ACVR8P_005750 [Pseudomonas aeruginosa]
MLDFMVLAQQCAPTVAPQTMAAVVQVESSFNPYAIGVVGGRLRGFRPDKAGEPSYVQKVLAQANVEAKPIPVVPSIAPGAARPQRVTAAGSGPVKVTAHPGRSVDRAGRSTPAARDGGRLRAGQSDGPGRERWAASRSCPGAAAPGERSARAAQARGDRRIRRGGSACHQG